MNMNIIASIDTKLGDFWEWLAFPPRPAEQQPLPAPPEKPMQKQAKTEKQDDGWRRAFSVVAQDGKKTFAVNVDTRTQYRGDGFDSDVRTSHGTKVVLSPELTDADLLELKRRNIAEKAGRHLKAFFATNPMMSAADLESVNGKYAIRTCEGALAAFRCAAGVD